MTQKTATPVLKNKFWIVEDNGKKIATIQAVEGGGFTYVKGATYRERFPALKDIEVKYNVSISDENNESAKTKDNSLYGYPVGDTKTFNESYNAQTKMPIFTKTPASKSQYCAGFYCIELDNDQWISHFCPKLITVRRYAYMGPFKNENEMLEAWKTASPHLS